MPTKASRCRRWLRDGKARVVHNDLGVFQIQLVDEPSGTETQDVVIGVDPGKDFSGIAVQSSQATLAMIHLTLPFKNVRKRMEQRAMLRHHRRYRNCRRRPMRSNNRRHKKVPPSIKANRQLELRVVRELSCIFPVSKIVYEVVKARGTKGFSPVMVGQVWAIGEMAKIAPVETREGWQTSNLRKHLGLVKSKNKAEQTPASHAVDGVTLAAHGFLRYERDLTGHDWKGGCAITAAPFLTAMRPPISRRQLHLQNPLRGGLRGKYGGSVTRHESRKGDYVKVKHRGLPVLGWCSGDRVGQLSVSDHQWKRIGQFSAISATLIHRNRGLLVRNIKGDAKWFNI